MYGKFFASAFEGSMMAAGPEVFAVWAYVIAKTHDSIVELNPRLLAAVIGSTTERMQSAIDVLCAPDHASRSTAADGCRLVKQGQYQYHVTNHTAYKAIRNEDDRRAYNREAKRKERAKKADVKRPVNDSQRNSIASAQAETETETEEKQENPSSASADAPPVRAKSKTPSTTIAIPHGVDAQVWADWLVLRKAKKAPVTLTVVRGAEREAAKAGMSLDAFLQIWCRRGSQGLEASWLKADEIAAHRAPTLSFRERDELAAIEKVRRMTGGLAQKGASARYEFVDEVQDAQQRIG